MAKLTKRVHQLFSDEPTAANNYNLHDFTSCAGSFRDLANMTGFIALHRPFLRAESERCSFMSSGLRPEEFPLGGTRVVWYVLRSLSNLGGDAAPRVARGRSHASAAPCPA